MDKILIQNKSHTRTYIVKIVQFWKEARIIKKKFKLYYLASPTYSGGFGLAFVQNKLQFKLHESSHKWTKVCVCVCWKKVFKLSLLPTKKKNEKKVWFYSLLHTIGFSCIWKQIENVRKNDRTIVILYLICFIVLVCQMDLNFPLWC